MKILITESQYKLLTESIFSAFQDIDDETWEKAYIQRINRDRSDLLVKASLNPNFVFVLGKNMKHTSFGKQGYCETNVYKFIKEKLRNGENNFFPVGGFLFENFFPIEHWWVYDNNSNTHIEVTPIEGNPIPCYAGIINFNINDEILNSDNVFDVEFFKGGNVYHQYFT